MYITPVNNYNNVIPTIEKKRFSANKESNIQYSNTLPTNIYYPLMKPNFKGFSPVTKTNRANVAKIIDVIKDASSKKIAIIAHRNPDGDAIGSMLAFKRMIQSSTGKTADAFVNNPLADNFRFIDSKDEFRVLKNELEVFDKADVFDELGSYDLVIALDTAEKKLFDKNLYERLLKKAKNIIKIDHHPILEGAQKSDYQYGAINFVDSTKESASQLVMEFMKPLGLKPTKEFTDPISMGLITDTAQFKFAKSPSLYKDISDLSKTSNMGNVIESVHEMDKNTFKTISSILKDDVKLTPDGKIAYFVLDASKIDSNIKNLTGSVFAQVSQIKGVDYYFSIVKNSDRPNLPVTASVRSKNKSIVAKMMELGGGGHDRACGLKAEGVSAEDFITKIIEKLNEVK